MTLQLKFFQHLPMSMTRQRGGEPDYKLDSTDCDVHICQAQCHSLVLMKSKWLFNLSFVR